MAIAIGPDGAAALGYGEDFIDKLDKAGLGLDEKCDASIDILCDDVDAVVVVIQSADFGGVPTVQLVGGPIGMYPLVVKDTGAFEGGGYVFEYPSGFALVLCIDSRVAQ